MRLRTIFPCLLISLAIPLTAPARAASAGYGGEGQTTQPSERGRYTMNHAEIGVFADYFRLTPGSADANYFGLGGRAAFSISPNFAVEGEMNYDFARDYSTTTPSGTGGTTTIVTTKIRPVTGLFGPKAQFGTSGPFRVFATAKVGFVDFSFTNPNNVTGTQFSNSVAGIGDAGTHLALYPGGGFEGFFGPLGLRFEAGDEVYLNNGAHNNVRVTVGPTLRF